jgi:multiple sugar transport system permease protein
MAATEMSSARGGERREPPRRMARREAFWGYLFLMPTAAGFLLFILGPMLGAFGISTLKWDLLSPAHFAGLVNFAAMLKDPRLGKILLNTLQFVVGDVLLNIVLGIGLALLLRGKIARGMGYLARLAFFFPVIVSVSSAAAIWIFFLQKDLGILNYYLHLVGLPRIPWLGSSQWSLRSVVLFDVWKNVGFYAMVFLAGLHNIPPQLIEAAVVDGASEGQLLRRVTLPLLTPSIFFALVIALINGFQVFAQSQILTRGGPGDSSRTVVMYIYEQGFRYFQMGYASSVAVLLFVVIAGLTLLQFRASERWVFYQ